MNPRNRRPSLVNSRRTVLKDFTDRVPPQNLEMEASVLGAILIDADAIVKVADILSPEDFHSTAHGLVYKACVALYETRKAIDILTLANKLEEMNELANIGGKAFIAELAGYVPTAANVINYAQVVADKALLRRIIHAAGEIASAGFEETEDVKVALDKAEDALFKVSKQRLQENFIPIRAILDESFDRIDKLHKGKSKISGISTGFKDLDYKLAGLHASDLVILASRPSMGKTSLALNIAYNVSVKEGIPVGFFALEMSKEQMVDRLLVMDAGIDSWKLRTGNLEDDDFPKIGNSMAKLSEAPLYIDDTAITTALEIRTKARRLASEVGLGLIVVDYLQLMSSSSYYDNRVQEISEISRALKGIARELDVPILALSQLSRAVENRPKKIPELADLRESGSIEQDADVVMFIYREEVYDNDTERKNIADILIKKHRSGPIGSLELLFQSQFMRFRDLDKKRVA